MVFYIQYFYFSKDTEELDFVSCTDKKCLWDYPQKLCLQQYEAVPLEDHECNIEKFKKSYPVSVSNETKEIIRNLLLNCNPDSALAKHKYG